jgi:MSHA pilin protein MshD
MYIRSRESFPYRERGLSLIELTMFIVIVGIALAGVLHLMSLNTQRSVDPLIQKQALAIAEALLEEIEQMPFTKCDPDGYDGTVDPATCAKSEGLGPEDLGELNEEKRGGAVPFDNVNDYHDLKLDKNSKDVSGGVSLPDGYRAGITITTSDALGPSGAVLSDPELLRITVNVAYQESDIVTLEGYRARYAPTP